ncbi:MAG TPA: ATP12 family protein [Sphingomonas sp.]|nr:ATP12 family protein [Sphingomonas sp.]
MRRFYTVVAIADGAILLDDRPVRTPARAPLIVPYPALAEAVADEWRQQGEEIDPRTMPLTGLSNAAIDRVAPDPAAFARPLAAYAEADLLCYRAEAPAELKARQARAWDPLLDWASGRYDVHFCVTSGVVHAPQPLSTVKRLGEALVARNYFGLAAMAPLVTIGGSLVTALALSEAAIDADAAFNLTHLDELWQAERWGEDALALHARAARMRDFQAAAELLTLL